MISDRVSIFAFIKKILKIAETKLYTITANISIDIKYNLFFASFIINDLLSFNDYNIVSDSDLNAVVGYITYKDKSNNIYPLSEYFQKNTPDNSWEWVKDNNQLTLNRWGKSIAT
jgi:hypothetical protein